MPISQFVCAGTSTKEKAEYCQKLGADSVYDYNDEQGLASLRDQFQNGFDVIWNTSLHHNFKLLLPLLAHRGSYVLMSGLCTVADLPLGDLYTKDASIKGFAITNATQAEYDRAASMINSLLFEDQMTVRIADRLSLDQAREGHRQVETGGLWGKLLITL